MCGSVNMCANARECIECIYRLYTDFHTQFHLRKSSDTFDLLQYHSKSHFDLVCSLKQLWIMKYNI